MANFSHEPIFEAACHAGEIPGAVLVAADATGKFKYAKAFGKTSRGETLSVDSVMWIASCTKLMTAVAALQQVDRGNIGLDEDVTGVLSEVAALQVLEGFDEEGKPILKERQGTITLRRLAKFRGFSKTHHRTIIDEFSEPLIFQPGKSWMYGAGSDWAGKLVERLAGLTLEEYMRTNIWDPLAMRYMSFFPDSDPGMKARKIGMSIKDEAGKLTPAEEGYIHPYADRDEPYGGATCWGCAEGYINLLQTLCANDGRVLSKELVDEMFRPQLGPEPKESMNRLVKDVETYRRVFGNSFDLDRQVLDHGLGGQLGTKDEVRRRKAGTMSWGGLPNLIWWIDREAGLCGAYFSNLVPMGDARVVELEAAFERVVYERYEEFKRQQQ
ncbi:hypothetical protein AAE478_005872 [Parahypoxylon ruwenzoriense]